MDDCVSQRWWVVDCPFTIMTWSAPMRSIPSFLKRIIARPPLPKWLCYGITTMLVLAALLVRLSAQEALRGHTFLLFFPVILLSAAVFGRGQGLYAALLSAILAGYYLLEPISNFFVETGGDLFGMSLFLLVGTATAIVVGALHQAYLELDERREQLASYGRQRELMLRELSHRIMNDLAALSSLLSMQARSTEDVGAQGTLRSAADSVQVMGRVYQRLRMREDGVVVDIGAFIEDLCSDLKASLMVRPRIVLEVSAEQHLVKVQRAVAIGLIINELVTNTLKHAFAGRESGRIQVTFKKSNGDFLLEVVDDGVGIDQSHRAGGLGHQIVRSFATLLGGRVTFRAARPGTRVDIRFPA